MAANTQNAAATASLSPTKLSKSKAAEGAALALKAAGQASFLKHKAQDRIVDSELQDSSLPCAPVSPSGVEVEREKIADATTPAESPWYASATVSKLPALLGAPHPADPTFTQLSKAGLRGLSTNRKPLSIDTVLDLVQILGAQPCQLTQLDLSKSLDSDSAAPAISKKLLDETMDAIAESIGPESDEENIAKLTAQLEKIKVDFTTYEAGIEALARKKLDRYAAIFQCLEKNRSVTDLDLSSNNFGAPNSEGKSNFAPLRKLSAVIDGNPTISRLNLRGNRMGATGVGIVAKAMSKNVGIHTLDLGGCDITVEGGDEEEDPDVEPEDPVFGELQQGLVAVAEVFKKNKFLKCLCLRGNRIKSEIDEAGEDDGVETPLGQLLEPFKKFHRLTVLDLAGNELGPGGARQLADALSQNKSLEVLDISDNGLGPKGLKHMARLLKATKSIHTLHIQLNGLAGKGTTKKSKREALEAATEFGLALSQSSLVEINLSSNHFGPELSAAILQGLAASRISKLFFAMNDLCGAYTTQSDDRALNCIVAALLRGGIKELGLSGNFLQQHGIELLTGAGVEGEPSPLNQVQSLDVSRNALGDEGAALFFQYLTSESASIHSLNLSHNGIKDVSVLGRAVRVNPLLAHINLANNLLGEGPMEGFRGLIDGIADRPHLRSLDVSHNLLNDEHAGAIGFLCRTATAPFSGLDCRDNPHISIAMTEKLVNSLKSSRCIQSLKVSSQAGDRGELLKILLNVLQENQSLTDLDLAFPVGDLEESAVKSIQSALLVNALRK